MLKLLLALLLPAAAHAEGWPVFNLNDGPARGRVAPVDHIWVPPVPEPKVVAVEWEEIAPSERIPVFSPYKAGYVSVQSAVKVKIKRDKGEAVFTFPRVDFGDPAPGDRAALYVRLGEGGGAPVSVSWATVICSGTHYLGYKGSTFTMPQDSGSFSVSETLAMGYPKLLIARSHPWLFEGGVRPEGICSPGAGEALASFDAEHLPASAGGADLRYDPRRNTLRIAWKR